MATSQCDFVIIGGGSAGSALGNRLSADRVQPRGGARGRADGLRARRVHPHALGAGLPDRQPLLRLEVRVRARAVHERPPGLPRARQGARRLELHQRHDLPARQRDGLRALGRAARAWRRGTTPTASPTSSGWRRAWRPTSATRTAATPARSCWSAARPRARCSARSSRPSSRPASRSRTTSTATARRASPPSTATSTTASGCPRRAPTSIPVMDRPNLEVKTRAFVTRILFEGKRAVGVEYTRGRGRTETVRAGEVVLCGGAINSPQLLQLSGVGNARELEALGIGVVHDLPGVGENLQDHLEVYVQYASQPAGVRRAVHEVAQPPARGARVAAVQERARARPTTSRPAASCAATRTSSGRT